MSRRLRHLLALSLLLAVLGCERTFPTCEDGAALPAVAGVPTWHADVRPVYEARCVRCHSYGGIGGFALDSYIVAQEWAGPSANAVVSGRMPPWKAASCCQDYSNDFDVTPAEAALIQAWADGGAPEGDPAEYVPPDVPSTELPRVDLSLQMPEAYLPALADGETDRSQCFLLDWDATETTWVTGLGVRPGNAAIVHHAIVLIAGPEVVAGFEAADAADADVGWSCPGGVVWGATGWIGGWSPGWAGQVFPGDLGQQVDPGSKIILSVHYSVVDAVAGPDQTTIDLMLDDDVAGGLESLSVYDPAWLSGGLAIPANDEDVVHSYVSTPTPRLDGADRELVAVNLHMHERGSHGQVAILHPDGSTTCLLQVDDWDYDWQSDHLFAAPITLAADDELLVECHFDNTAGNQRVVNGQRETPRDLNWAEDEEMCVAYVTAKD